MSHRLFVGLATSVAMVLALARLTACAVGTGEYDAPIDVGAVAAPDARCAMTDADVAPSDVAMDAGRMRPAPDATCSVYCELGAYGGAKGAAIGPHTKLQ